MEQAIAIITARGGSKRIPGKNIREFCGKPILAYSILAAKGAGCFSEVMVSTDDEAIAQIARSYGANVPFLRSEKTSDDFASTSDVILEVLSEYEKLGRTFSLACCIYPTAPFVTGEKLAEAYRRLCASDADSLIPVVAFSYPPQRAMAIRGEYLQFLEPVYLDARSQDLEKHYHDVGQFYFLRTSAFLQNRRLMVGKILPYEVSELEVQDIDQETDWKLAELKYRYYHNMM
ncbi:MAG: pseudaminic acid cytidylyltransferase [Clostridium sp.]|jgi:N-acylneuraminate cytidylyltransferase|nr:pseudaminic acid cytidylyltransferase [Clostridium sp.]